DVGRTECSGLRIVVGALTQRIDVGSGKTRVEPAGRPAIIALQVLAKFPAVDAQVCPEYVIDGKAGVLVKLLGDGGAFRRAELGAPRERMGIVPHGELLHFGQQSIETLVLRGQLV